VTGSIEASGGFGTTPAIIDAARPIAVVGRGVATTSVVDALVITFVMATEFEGYL
jgi:hypothetical protein